LITSPRLDIRLHWRHNQARIVGKNRVSQGKGNPRRGAEFAGTMQATTTASECAQRPQFSSLTSLRFVAAMTVVTYHYFSLGAISSPADESLTRLDPISRALGSYLPALSNGYLAVGFFFVLSGFVLAHANFRLMEEGSFDYARFLKRRFSRIYPLHFLVTVGYGALFLLALWLGITVNNSENFTWMALLSNVFLLRGLNLIGRLTFNGPAWYVSSQFHLYLLFPMLGALVLRSPFKSLTTLFVTIALFLAIYFGTSDHQLLTQRTYDFGILRAVTEFPIGLALYRVCRDYELSGAKFIRPIHALVAGLAVLLVTQLSLDDSLTIVLLALLIFTCAAAELHYELKWFTHPWLIYGGEISFAIYLIHVPFLACARKTFSLLGASPASLAEGILLVICTILLLPMAAFVHHWIELPANEWTRNLLERSGKHSLSAA
jgi:peptidoglycan/LPS O-acetylase OafA/YrhL